MDIPTGDTFDTNDTSVVQVGTNPSIDFAVQFWETLSSAARKDGRLLDPLWKDREDEGNTTTNSSPSPACHYTSKIVLTKSAHNDRKLYRCLRSSLGGFSIRHIPGKTAMSSPEWSTLVKFAEAVVQDSSSTRWLRQDAGDMFWVTDDGELSDGLLAVSRAQFVYVELARIQEEVYGADFRKKLELHDMKLQADAFENSFRYMTRENVAMKALELLQTQWPNPSPSTLETTGVLRVIQAGANSAPTEKVRTKCEGLLRYWQQLHDLGRISKVLSSSTETQALRPALQSAGEAFVESSTQAVDVEGRATSNETTLAATNGHSSPAPMAPPTEATMTTVSAMKDFTITQGMDPAEATTTFRKYGIVMIPDLIDSVDELLEHAKHSLESLIVDELEPRLVEIDSGTEEIDFAEVRQKPGGRLDNRYQILDDPNSPIARLGRRLEQELPQQLFHGEDSVSFRLLHGSVIHALPRRHQQVKLPDAELWHRGGPSLFTTAHHDTHSFEVYIPLVDVSDDNGATEFVPKTHEDAVFDEVSAKVISLAQRYPTEKHELAVRTMGLHSGAMVIFDVRMLHRNLPNATSHDTPILSFTFARSWFLEESMLQNQSIKQTHDPILQGKIHMLSKLRETIEGSSPGPTQLTLDETYGHPHYTKRFDLLLLECYFSKEAKMQSTAMMNTAAVMNFSYLCIGDKESMAREFVYSFSDGARARKARALLKVRDNMAKQSAEGNEDLTDSSVFKSEANALYELTASILLKESMVLPKLGFTRDMHGLWTLLATLKAHASRRVLGCFGVAESRLEEAFTSWWHAGEGRFSFLPGSATSPTERSKRKLLVVFSDMGSDIVRPEWGESLGTHVHKENLDVLHVLDPAFSWYCQDPKGEWKGCHYYFSQLQSLVAGYGGVMFLGNSVGGSAALRFSPLAARVLVFTPQVNMLGNGAFKRVDCPDHVKKRFKARLIDALHETSASVTIHFGEHSEVDTSQIKMLPVSNESITLVPHDYVDHGVTGYLKSQGLLNGIVEKEVKAFIST